MGYRKITVDERDFHWMCGSRHVAIRAPNGTGFHPTLTEISGWTCYDIERGQHKRYFSVTPGMVEKYIRENILKIP